MKYYYAFKKFIILELLLQYICNVISKSYNMNRKIIKKNLDICNYVDISLKKFVCCLPLSRLLLLQTNRGIIHYCFWNDAVKNSIWAEPLNKWQKVSHPIYILCIYLKVRWNKCKKYFLLRSLVILNDIVETIPATCRQTGRPLVSFSIKI